MPEMHDAWSPTPEQQAAWQQWRRAPAPHAHVVRIALRCQPEPAAVDAALALLRGMAQDKGVDGHLATLKGPVVQALLTYADDRALRETVYTAYNTRASEQGPQAGQFDNSERIAQIMALRHEAAQLIGGVSMGGRR